MKGKKDLSRAVRFLGEDIWRMRQRDLLWSRGLLIRTLRVIFLSFRGLTQDRCALRASSLTFYSLLSLVPVFAMVLAIAKGFRFQRALEKMLLEQLQGQEEVVSRILGFSETFLESATGGFVAGTGVVLLLYSIIRILAQIETAFNDIWGIRQARSIGRKISDYLSLTLIAPIVFLISSTLTVFVTSGVKFVLAKIALLGPLGPAILFIVKFLPYGVLWVLFTFIYIVLPNAKVRFLSGLLGGVIAGTLFQLFQWGYINFQIGVAKYNAIYGSFAALPLFFIWLQMSWLIVLFGAEISFAHQNAETYEFEKDCLNVSYAFKRLIFLGITHLLVTHFLKKEPPLNARQISHRLEIPLCLVHPILDELAAAGLVSEVMGHEDKGGCFQPARDPEVLTIKYVIDAMEERGSDSIPVAPSEGLEKLSAALKSFSDLLESSPANRRLKEI